MRDCDMNRANATLQASGVAASFSESQDSVYFRYDAMLPSTNKAFTEKTSLLTLKQPMYAMYLTEKENLVRVTAPR